MQGNSCWKILVVDDEALNVKLLRHILEKAGYEVLEAHGGAEARDRALEEAPDLILLDIMMPGETGFETCRKLKEDARTGDIPVIFLSALGDVQNKVEGFRSGGVDYVPKPFYREEVLARIRTQLKLRSAYRRIIEEQSARLQQIREAQQAILVDPRELPEANFGVAYLPYQEAGGDLYEVFRVDRERYGYFLGDVSGHDLGASFSTSALKALVRQNFDSLHSPQESMGLINSVLASIFTSGQHLTAAYVLLDRDAMELTFLSAGHPPLIRVPLEGEPYTVVAEGDLLGAFPTAYFQPVTLEVAQGDRLFLYSDGLIESLSGQDREWAFQRLLQACGQCRAGQVQEEVECILEAVLPGGRRDAVDDIVLLGVRV